MAETRAAIEAVWRVESTKVIGALVRMVRDVGFAEDLAHDALVAALERWPEDGIPDRPGAWLLQTARNRGLDRLRRAPMLASAHAELARTLDEREAPDLDALLDEDIHDDLLRMVFVSCHPVLSPEARVSLTLRLLGGLTTEEIARAFLVPEPTIAQRIVRAKKTIAEANVPFEVPRAPERAERLASVLEVVYFVFNEGYAATSGPEWMRPALCEDALRLARILTRLAPNDAEVHGLLALLELQFSRVAARVGNDGEPVLLLEQNRRIWDVDGIERGLASLADAERLASPRGPYTLQAGIAACHARARTAEETDWPKIAALYTALAAVRPDAVVELNRAVAFGMAFGPAAGLEIVEALVKADALDGYHLLSSVHGDLLEKLGRRAEAARAFDRAAEQTKNERERRLLRERAAANRTAS